MSKLIRHTLLLGLFPLLLPTMAAAVEQHDTSKNSLPPDKIQQIQAISQSILAARRNQPANPEMENLRQRMDELHKAVVKLYDKSLATGKANALSLGNGQSVTPDIKLQQDIQTKKSERAEAETVVSQALDRVRSQRAVVEQKVAESAVGEDHSMKRNAAAKVRGLEDELDKALQSPPEERAASLHEIKDRLAVKHGSLVETEQGKTPTIATIVRHRE
jgi:hypothetical protein